MYEHPEVDFQDMAMRFMDIRKRVYTFPRNAEATAFEIYFFGGSEPQHIFLPFRNGFNIDKMFYADVFSTRKTFARAGDVLRGYV